MGILRKGSSGHRTPVQQACKATSSKQSGIRDETLFEGEDEDLYRCKLKIGVVHANFDMYREFLLRLNEHALERCVR